MSFEGDDLNYQNDVVNLLREILVELKKLNFMMSESTDLDVTDEDVK